MKNLAKLVFNDFIIIGGVVASVGIPLNSNSIII